MVFGGHVFFGGGLCVCLYVCILSFYTFCWHCNCNFLSSLSSLCLKYTEIKLKNRSHSIRLMSTYEPETYVTLSDVTDPICATQEEERRAASHLCRLSCWSAAWAAGRTRAEESGWWWTRNLPKLKPVKHTVEFMRLLFNAFKTFFFFFLIHQRETLTDAHTHMLRCTYTHTHTHIYKIIKIRNFTASRQRHFRFWSLLNPCKAFNCRRWSVVKPAYESLWAGNWKAAVFSLSLLMTHSQTHIHNETGSSSNNREGVKLQGPPESCDDVKLFWLCYCSLKHSKIKKVQTHTHTRSRHTHLSSLFKIYVYLAPSVM